MDDSNIVFEVQFGEASNGAALVQGSFVAADDAGGRPKGTGLQFRRLAGGGASENRERTFREMKMQIEQWAMQLNQPQVLVDNACRFYRMATNSNFVQGRRKILVAAICFYAAARKAANNRIMLIDLADLIRIDVFLLGMVIQPCAVPGTFTLTLL